MINKVNITEFEPELQSEAESIARKYGDQAISQLPKIVAWRDAYRSFGVKAKDDASSVEAHRRAAKYLTNTTDIA